jgi:hypothetical protein
MAIGTVLLLVPITLALGIAIDAANINRVRGNVQASLDGAAMEIAVHLNSGLTDDELEALGSGFVEANLHELDLTDEAELPSLNYLGVITDQSGTQRLTVEATQVYSNLIPRNLIGQEGAGSSLLHFRSEISARMGDTACVYALNHAAPRAVTAAGNTSVVMDGCVIASNSSAADAIYVGGSATLAADCLQSSGGIDATAGLTTDCAQNRENAWRLPDPFKGLIEPVPPIVHSNPKQNDTTVQPGRYFDLDLDGTKTLEPGLYYIEGSLSIKGTISGTGITFFMKDGGITANGNASLSLSAPTSGDYAGMLFWSSQSNTSSHTFNGNGATDLNGFLYFPKGSISYSGNNATTSTCMRIVADTITMTGSSTLQSDCSEELGGREARVAGPLYYSK